MTPAPPSRARSGEARRERRSRETRPLLNALLKRWSMSYGDHELASSELSRGSTREIPCFKTPRQDRIAVCYSGHHLTAFASCVATTGRGGALSGSDGAASRGSGQASREFESKST